MLCSSLFAILTPGHQPFFGSLFQQADTTHSPTFSHVGVLLHLSSTDVDRLVVFFRRRVVVFHRRVRVAAWLRLERGLKTVLPTIREAAPSTSHDPTWRGAEARERRWADGTEKV